MADHKYLITMDMVTSQFDAKAKAVDATVQKLTNGKYEINIDFNKGNQKKLTNFIDEIENVSPELSVEMKYDLQKDALQKQTQYVDQLEKIKELFQQEASLDPTKGKIKTSDKVLSNYLDDALASMERYTRMEDVPDHILKKFSVVKAAIESYDEAMAKVGKDFEFNTYISDAMIDMADAFGFDVSSEQTTFFDTIDTAIQNGKAQIEDYKNTIEDLRKQLSSKQDQTSIVGNIEADAKNATQAVKTINESVQNIVDTSAELNKIADFIEEGISAPMDEAEQQIVETEEAINRFCSGLGNVSNMSIKQFVEFANEFKELKENGTLEGEWNIAGKYYNLNGQRPYDLIDDVIKNTYNPKEYVKITDAVTGVTEYYHVVKDSIELTEALSKYADSFGSVGWSSGNIEYQLQHPEYTSDSIGYVLSHSIGYPGLGSGLYYTSKYGEIKNWNGENANGYKKYTYAFDPSKFDKTYNALNKQEIPKINDLTNLLIYLSAAKSKLPELGSTGGLIHELDKIASSNNISTNGMTTEELIDRINGDEIWEVYKEIFNKIGITAEDINNQILETVQIINQTIDDMGGDKHLVKSKLGGYESISTSLFEKYITGLSTAYLDGYDNVGYGSLVFQKHIGSQLSKTPIINFGTTKYSKVFDDLTAAKTLNLKTKNASNSAHTLINQYDNIFLSKGYDYATAIQAVNDMMHDFVSFEDINPWTNNNLIPDKTAISDIQTGTTAILNLADALQMIIDASDIAGAPSIGKFFHDLSNNFIDIPQEAIDAFETLGLVDSNGKFSGKVPSHGYAHSGAVIGKDYSIIAREDYYQPKTDALVPKLHEAAAAGANVGEIVATLKDDVEGLYYEIQKTMPGLTIDDDNIDFLNATDEQINKLIDDILILRKTGLYVDVGGDNILYDPQKGFSFIDLAPSNKHPEYQKNKFEDVFDYLNDYVINGNNQNVDSTAFETAWRNALANTPLKYGFKKTGHDEYVATDTGEVMSLKEALDDIALLYDYYKKLGDATDAISEATSPDKRDLDISGIIEKGFTKIGADEYVSNLTGEVMSLEKALDDIEELYDDYKQYVDKINSEISEDIPSIQEAGNETIEWSASDILSIGFEKVGNNSYISKMTNELMSLQQASHEIVELHDAYQTYVDLLAEDFFGDDTAFEAGVGELSGWSKILPDVLDTTGIDPAFTKTGIDEYVSNITGEVMSLKEVIIDVHSFYDMYKQHIGDIHDEATGTEDWDVSDILELGFTKTDSDQYVSHITGEILSLKDAIVNIAELYDEYQEYVSEIKAKVIDSKVEPEDIDPLAEFKKSGKYQELSDMLNALFPDSAKTLPDQTVEPSDYLDPFDDAFADITESHKRLSDVSGDVSSDIQETTSAIIEETSATTDAVENANLLATSLDSIVNQDINNSLEELIRLLGELSVAFQNVYGDATLAPDQLFSEIQQQAKSISAKKLTKAGTFNKETEPIAQSILSRYRSYLQRGGDKTIDDLGASKALTKYLNSNLSTEQPVSALDVEGTAFTNIEEQATSAALSKEHFAAANEALLQSVVNSINGIKDEGQAFKSLNGFINLISKQPKDQDALSAWKNELEEIIGLLRTDVGAESFIKSLESISQSGASLKDLADILRASKKQIQDAQNLKNPTLNKTDKSMLDKLSNTILGDEYLTKTFGAKLSSVQDEFNTFDPSTGSIDEVRKHIEQLRDSVTDTSNTIKSEANRIATGFSTLSKGATKFVDLAGRPQQTSDEAEWINNYIAQYNEFTDAMQKFQSQYGYTPDSITKSASAFEERISKYVRKNSSSLMGQLDSAIQMGGLNKETVSNLESARTHMGEIFDYFDSLDGSIDVSKIKEFVGYIKDAKDALKSSKSKDNQLVDTKELTDRAAKINQVLSKYSLPHSLRSELEGLRDELESLAKGGEDAADGMSSIDRVQFDNIDRRLSDLMNKVESTGRKGRWSQKFNEALVNQGAQFIAQYFSIRDLIRYGREITQTVTQVDTAIKELKKVSSGTDAQMAQSFTQSAKVAKEYGATITDVIDSTSDWARLGYSLPDSQELARVTTMYQNIARGISQESASEYLVSTLQGYQMQADQAESIIDSINKVANNFAIDQAGIGEALERSAASFFAAHTDLNKSIALVTTGNAVLQNPEAVGTAFKTLSARLRGASAELQELGEDETEVAETTSKLRDEVKALTGFDIMSDANTYKDIYEIMLGIGKEWSNLTDVQQAALAEDLAGKRMASVLYAVLNNTDRLQEAYRTAMNSAGSAAEAQEIYASSVQYSINAAKASLQELATNFLSSDLLKGLIDAGNTLLGIVNEIVDSLGSVGSILTALGGLDIIKALLGGRSLTSAIVEGITAKQIGKTAGTMLGNIGLMKNAATAGETAGAAMGSGILKGLASALGPVGIAAIIAGAIITGGAIAYKKYHDNLFKKGKESAEEYGQSNASLNSYIAQYKELNNQITSGNLSEEETYNIKSQILDLQKQIISQYGYQASGIDLVNGKLSEQEALLNGISVTEASRTLRENQKEYDEVRKRYNHQDNFMTNLLSDQNDPELRKELNGRIRAVIDDTITSIDHYVDDLNGVDLDVLNITGNAQQITEEIDKIEAAVDEYRLELIAQGRQEDATEIDSMMQNIISASSETRGIWEDIRDTIAAISNAEFISKGGKSYIDAYNNAINAYNEALANPTQEGVSEARATYNAAKNDLYTFAGNNGLNVDTLSLTSSINEVAESLYYAKEIAGQFGDTISDDNPYKRFDKYIDDVVDKTKGLNMDDVDFASLLNLGSDALAQDLGLANLRGLLDNVRSILGMSVDEFVVYMTDIGAVSTSASTATNQVIADFSAFSKEIGKALTSLDSVNAAVVSAFSGKGLGLEIDDTGAIAGDYKTLLDAFKDVPGFSSADLFYETANGIKVNQKELRKLKSQQDQITRQKFKEKQLKLTNDLKNAEKALTQAQGERSTREAQEQIETLRSQLSELDKLSAAYDGATSAYQKWLDAQSAGEAGDIYKNIQSTAISRADELYKAGLVGTEEFRALAELYSGKDLSTAGIDQVVAAYKQFDAQIDGTSYKMRDFFTEDITGANKFADALVKLGHAAKDAEGNISFKYLNTDDLAVELGTSVDMVESILHMMKDYGAEIQWFSNEQAAQLEVLDKKFNGSLTERINNAGFSNGIKKQLSLLDLGNIDTVEDASKAVEHLRRIIKNSGEFNLDTDQLELMNDLLNYAIEKLNILNGTEISPDVSFEAFEQSQTVLTNLQDRIQKMISSGWAVDDERGTIKFDAILEDSQVQQAINALLSADPQILAKLNLESTDAQSMIMEILTELELIDGTTATADVEVEGSEQANKEINSTQKAANKLDNTSIYFGVGTNASAATKAVNDLTSAINRVPTEKQVKFNVSANKLGLTAEQWAMLGFAQGTAHVNGTALASGHGNWGIPRNERALINEIGPEIVVRGSNWFIPNHGRPTMNYPLKKDDIVFNAKQSEELLKNGYIRNGYARANGTVGGSAYASTSGWWPVEYQKAPSAVPKSSGKAAAKYATSQDKSAKDVFKEIIDWIEVNLSRIERTLEGHKNLADYYSSYIKQNKELNLAIQQATSNIATNRAAYNKYIEEANNVGLDEHHASLVRSGKIAFEKITDEDLRDKIQQYQQWYEKALACEDTIYDLNVQLKQLSRQKIDNLIDDYETWNALLEEQNSNLEEQNKYYQSMHGVESVELLRQQASKANGEIEELRRALIRMNQERNTQLASGELIEGSKEDRQVLADIENVKTQINSLKNSVEELDERVRAVHWSDWNESVAVIDHLESQLDSLYGIMGDFTAYDENAKMTKNGVAQYNLLAQSIANSRKRIAEERKAIDTLNKEFKAGKINQATYNEEMREHQEALMGAINQTQQYRKSIIDLVKQGIEAETKAFSELISKQKESLQRQKEAVDYDRSISEKQTELNKLRAQLSALSGDTTLAAQAQRARLMEEISQKETEIEDARRDHAYDMAVQALDDEERVFTETQEEKAAALDYSLANQDQAIQEFLGKTTTEFKDTSDAINQIAMEFGVSLENSLTQPWKSATAAANVYKDAVAGVKVDSTTSTSNRIKTTAKVGSGTTINIEILTPTTQTGHEGYYKEKPLNLTGKAASGKRKARGLYLTDEEGLGTEAIITKAGVLRQLDSDTVFSRKQTDMLWNLSKMDFSSLLGSINNSSRNITVTNTYDSLLTVNGDVDKEALPSLQEILKQASEYTKRDITTTLRKLGVS